MARGKHARKTPLYLPRHKNITRGKVKALIADVLLWCLLGALLAAGFVNAANIAGGSVFSLRFENTISGQTAYKARQYSIEHSSEDTFWPTFWREEAFSFSSEYATVSADCIVFSGEATLVWPAKYTSGNAPGVLDDTGCAISTTLAWRLWGSTDVVGKTLEKGDEVLPVRGVFESERELALVSFRDEDVSQSWSAVELTGGSKWAVRSDAVSYASASGLGSPKTVLSGGGIAFAADAMSALPVIFLLIYALILFIGFIRKQSALIRTLVPFLILLGFALALPSLLELIPAWLIPSRWSDFSSWSSLITKVKDGVSEFISASPQLRDVDERMLFLKQAVLCLTSSICATAVCFRWHMRESKNKANDTAHS